MFQRIEKKFFLNNIYFTLFLKINYFENMPLDIDIIIIRNAIYFKDVNIIGFTMLLLALNKKPLN